jgi:TRAP-type mannitol/chloroaromatic compound transport system permease small subunit
MLYNTSNEFYIVLIVIFLVGNAYATQNKHIRFDVWI